MMDDEGRGARQRRKQSDPTCCPVCGVTVRSHEMEQHYSLEMERLNKLTVQKNRKSMNKDMTSTIGTTTMAAASTGATSTSPTNAPGPCDNKECWNTYQRIKNNRSSRLKSKNRKRRADDPVCPVCSERIPDDLNLHVELCLRRSEQNNGHSSIENDDDEDDINIDVEGESYEEYEWAGQTRIRASSLLEGGYSATGLHTSIVSQKNDDEDEDLNVDGDDTQIYGQAQYSERDVILPMVDNNKKENVYLRNLVIGGGGSEGGNSESILKDHNRNETNITENQTNGTNSSKFLSMIDNGLVAATSSNAFDNNRHIIETEIECESTASSSKIQIDLKDGSVREFTTMKSQRSDIESFGKNNMASAHIIEALKEKCREYETIIKNKSKCLICMDEYRVPVVSICCWHVHCEECWLRTLGARKLCPQCNMITSPTDLRKIYM